MRLCLTPNPSLTAPSIYKRQKTGKRAIVVLPSRVIALLNKLPDGQPFRRPDFKLESDIAAQAANHPRTVARLVETVVQGSLKTLGDGQGCLVSERIYQNTSPDCFSSFRSSRLIAARMSMNPPHEIYNNRKEGTRHTAQAK